MDYSMAENNGSNTFPKAVEEKPWEGPAIILVDLDAFFASVEQLDHPGWRGKPVIVGGDSTRRGVVSTASYEARKFGVHSAMASALAAKLCPDAHWTSGHYHRYREVSNQVMAILRDETPHVQQVSIDEAFCDISPTSINRESPVAIAQRIQRRVAELGVTCSIGLGSTKTIAKIASDLDKPQGLCVVYPGSEEGFLAPMPLKVLSGAGPATIEKLKALGIETLGDLAKADDDLIVGRLGKTGQVLLDRVRGVEDSRVITEEPIKSVSSETSFAKSVSNRKDLEASIDTMAAKVARRLRKKGLRGRTLTLKVRYENLSHRTTQRSLPQPSDDGYLFERLLHPMLDELWHEGLLLRLVGVAVSNFDDDEISEQLVLFDESQTSEDSNEAEISVQGATDRVKERFGEGALIYGRELRLKDSGTDTTAKNPDDMK